ncbi:hypothetical protein BJ684DRAFT_18201 [Piptocephalis cylindrospora]|uniref:Uncharacterized protein n=1 Tax=Piptocephalis cylindrospora TaxID=1907219 RepID=A0A4P9YAE4_9FUNG|nr:hypothetical protein BJ684DRAFT_18201 [Piptocephalis cylindrospora]|eukprot:RKP15461.1 hypothetical protein BJ684DRAFT_18201 [Piptocephalis cylindrospora]
MSPRRMKRGKRHLDQGAPPIAEPSNDPSLHVTTNSQESASPTQAKKRRKVHDGVEEREVNPFESLDLSDQAGQEETSDDMMEEGELPEASSSQPTLPPTTQPASRPPIILSEKDKAAGWTVAAKKGKKIKKAKNDRSPVKGMEGLVPQQVRPRSSDQPLPSFTLDTTKLKTSISAVDVRDAIFWCLGCGTNPSWLLVQQRALIRHVLLLHVPMLTPDPFYSYPVDLTIPLDYRPIPWTNFQHRALLATMERATASVYKDLPVLDQYFSHIFPVKGPGDGNQVHAPQLALLNVPMTNKQLREQNRTLAAEKEPTWRDYGRAG